VTFRARVRMGGPCVGAIRRRESHPKTCALVGLESKPRAVLSVFDRRVAGRRTARDTQTERHRPGCGDQIAPLAPALRGPRSSRLTEPLQPSVACGSSIRPATTPKFETSRSSRTSARARGGRDRERVLSVVEEVRDCLSRARPAVGARQGDHNRGARAARRRRRAHSTA